MAEVWRLVVLDVDVPKAQAQVRPVDGAERWVPLGELPDGVQVGDMIRVTQTAQGPRGEIEWIGSAHGV